MRSRKPFPLGFLSTLFCLVAVALAACGGGDRGDSGTTHAKAPDSQQVFVQPLSGADIVSFDPALSPDLFSIQAIAAVFTGLVGLDDKLNIIPELARSWEESSDGLTWTFHLRANLNFSNGTPLTATDVAYSIDRSLQPAVKSTVSLAYEGLILDSDKLNAGKIKTIINDSILTPDPQTVVIKTNKNGAYFLQTLSYPTSYVVERSLIDKYGDVKFTDHLTTGGGEGPWKVQEYNHSTGITLVPNPLYHGPRPQLKKMILAFYKDGDTIYNAYQVGQVGTTGTAGVPSAQVAQARTRTREYTTKPHLSIAYIAFNFLTKPFDNIHIRQAFALALNKDVLASDVLKNTAIATNHMVPQGMPGYFPGLKGPTGITATAGDPKKAKQLLQMGMQEEGWTSVSQIPPIKFTTQSSSKSNLLTAELQMWQNVLGIDVKPDTVSLAQLLNELSTAINNPHGIQMWNLGWGADYPDPQDFLSLQADKGAAYNSMNYGQNNSANAAQQQAIQRVLEQADVNPNQQDRMQQYNQAEQQLVDDVAWLPIVQGIGTVMTKPCVQGYAPNAESVVPPQDWANVYISTDTPCASA
jgi:oligopeptide transport system substrate-binding protein